ncbi:LysR family transcriptional regulator [Algiphilus sp.]|uniref:LysR family transcriptional regulator n=1 Tax=Algiphilus sp. TaxID=1872431 RepID=UPI003C695A97
MQIGLAFVLIAMARKSPAFDWNDIPVLLALADTGSMSRAAEALRIDVSTVSRRLTAAEGQLRSRLFIRGPGGYRPTDAGRTFIAGARRIHGDVHRLVDTTRNESERVAGTVRITSVDALISEWLTPALDRLSTRHPELAFQLIEDNRALSFTRAEADIAIRIARPRRDAALIMRRIGRIGMAVYGAPSFRDTPRERWRELPWLAFSDELADIGEMRWLAALKPEAPPRLRARSVRTLQRACEAGLGLALLPCFLAESARLTRLSPEPEVTREMWLLRHKDAARIRRFRAVADWIAETAADDLARFEGTQGLSAEQAP